MGYSQQERIALCALLDETGPDAPTLCAGWSTGDLAAHLVVREHRLDAAAGVLGGPLAGHTARVQRRLRERMPFGDLVAVLRSGPPRFSPFGLPGMDERLNGVEYFVHHEDIRRAAPGWEPRELADCEADALWRQLRASRRLLRRLPVGVELARDDTSNGNLRLTAKNATPAVTVIGPPAELTMWAYGRTAAANVRFDGTQSAVARLSGSRWGPGAPSLPGSGSRWGPGRHLSTRFWPLLACRKRATARMMTVSSRLAVICRDLPSLDHELFAHDVA